MELAKSFEPTPSRRSGTRCWEARGYFKPSMRAGAPPFCIQLPPPNVTGTLHMGHAFQQTLMDVLIRYHRMRGDNTLWQVGTDHAGIATQIVVEQQLKAQGKSRHDLGPRSVRRARVGVEGGVGLDDHAPDAPARRLGRLVARALHDGRRPVGRGARDVRAPVRRRPHLSRQAARQLGSRSSAPRCPTSKSTARRSRASSGRSAIRSPTAADALVVATTRPETMLGDVAVAVNPDDERYRDLVGKTRHAAADRPHDSGHRRRLRRPRVRHRRREDHAGARLQRLAGRRSGTASPPISIFNLDATVNDNAPAKYRGLDRYVARKAVLADLDGARACSCRRRRTRWSCRAAGAPARSSSRC